MMERTIFLLSLLTIGCAQDGDQCTDRRCLAQMLIKKEYLSPPQSENCTLLIEIPLIKYETLNVQMVELHLLSRLKADIQWMDPQLAWNTSLHPFEKIILPVNKIWTPDISVENGKSSMEQDSNDLLVYSNGTVSHKVVVMAEVNCGINLFNYPFAYDVCPIGLKSTPPGECGIVIDVGQVQLAETSHGDWETEAVMLKKKREDRNYIDVYLRIKYSNPFITLLLPTLLIMLADIFSGALPLRSGERNSFKVTLVLSFTMYLNILTNVLPGDSKCSPVIRIHFCICQVLMVISMLVSIVLTRVAEDGFDFFACFCKTSANKNARDNEENEDAEAKGDISVIQRDASEDSQSLQKIVRVLEAYNTKQAESERYQKLADKLDKIFFWGYFIVSVVYVSAMTLVMVEYQCEIDHFTFWD
ncbi:zinc-activated ligand-gated ion channel-like [Fundulus heteroclitus]|uniref:zinc-activated ligand-gated ion channel-like n=1 Tax=Fundulus heteroclitus TaxID=8078 RepID=UPI00165B0BBD|nr:zinc-activated ligand-gated ion channel-like [Fundulus heteroclitus]